MRGPGLQYVLQILRRNRWLLILSTIAAGAEAGLGLVYPYLSKHQVNVLEGRPALGLAGLRTPWAVFLLVLGLILAARLLAVVISGLGHLLETLVRERLVIDADRLLYEKLEQMDAGFLENPKNRKLVYSFFDVNVLPVALLEFFRSVVRIVISLTGILPIIALIDLRLCLLITAFSALQLVVLRFRMRRENAFRLFKGKAMAGINEMVFLLRYYFHQVLGASGEERIMPRFWEKRRQALALEMTQARIGVRYDLINHVIENLSLFASAVLIGASVLRGGMSIGAFVMVTLYTAQLQASLTGINVNIGEWYRLRSAFVQLGFFLAMKPRVDVSAARSPAGPLAGDVTLEGVDFHYPGLHEDEKAYIGHLVHVLELANRRREVWPTDFDLVREWQALLDEHRAPNPPVLARTSCRFERGKVTALVGRNGSGKSTMMKLLVRGYDPDAGRIGVGGEPLRGLDPRYVRRLFSLVTQTPFVLDSFSLRDNLLLGCRPDVTEAEVWAVLERLKLAPVVAAHGLDRLVGDEVSLSGGQAQLVVLARTMLQRRPFILLDEGTNQLDAEHELGILELLHEVKRDSTVVIITHRMTTARKADAILVLDEGRIVEQGTHEQLLAQEQGLYRRFWEIQVLS
ncbi:MAG TPA: ABC transporter ATP-binding protein [Polyangia bacterium]|jgi:ABC-type multidrug transport system fused ATPase/permease subunit